MQDEKDRNDTRSVGPIPQCVPGSTSRAFTGVTEFSIIVCVTASSVRAARCAALVSTHDHVIVVRSEGPDKGVHVVFHPVRQVASDGLGNWGDDGVKIKVGIHVQEMTEDTGKGAPEQGTAPLLHQPVGPARLSL